MAWSPYLCDDHKYQSFTRDACNRCVGSFKILFWSIVTNIFKDCYDYMESRLLIPICWKDGKDMFVNTFFKLSKYALVII